MSIFGGTFGGGFGSIFGSTGAAVVSAPPPVPTPSAVIAALDRLCQYAKDKPNIAALLSALVAPAQDVEDAFQDLLTKRGIETGEGVQLDVVGKIVGQKRNGLSYT